MRSRPLEGRSRAHEARSGIPPFQAFMDQHRAVVFRFLQAAVGPSEADDWFQETFLSALRAYPGLRNGENLHGWVMAIASRKAIDAARARARRPVPVAAVPERPGPVADAPPSFDDEVWRAVRRLPPRQGVAVVHRVVLDQAYEDVARAMGGSVETARANVYQGLKRLRKEVRLE